MLHLFGCYSTPGSMQPKIFEQGPLQEGKLPRQKLLCTLCTWHLTSDHPLIGLIWGFPKSRGPRIEPQIVGLLQGHPQKGRPPICKNSHGDCQYYGRARRLRCTRVLRLRCTRVLAMYAANPAQRRTQNVEGARSFWPCALQAPRRGPLKSPQASKP